MRMVKAMDLEEALRALRCGRGRMVNTSGWMQYVDLHGRRHFVVEEETQRPVSFHLAKGRIEGFRRGRPPGSARPI